MTSTLALQTLLGSAEMARQTKAYRKRQVATAKQLAAAMPSLE